MLSNPAGRITAFARALRAGEVTLAQLASLRAELNLTTIPQSIWNDADAQLERAPRCALAYAQVLRALTNDTLESTRAGLLLIRALNACGEFRAAIGECETVASQFATSDDAESVARVWWEAAFAETWLGNLDSARLYLDRARGALKEESVLWSARGAWIEGRIARDQVKSDEALHCLSEAHEKFAQAGDTLNAARLARELGHLSSRSAPARALDRLAETRALFEKENCPLESALCNFFIAQAYTNLDQYDQGLHSLALARSVFTEHQIAFFVSFCDLDAGLIHMRQNRFDEALSLFERARAAFRMMGAESEASSCEINIGVILLRRNRYEQARAIFESAAQQALASARPKKAAICFTNIGWCYLGQGRYADALNYFRQARAAYEREQVEHRLAWCDLNIGLAQLDLGQYAQAHETLASAREFFANNNEPSNLAECEMYLAQISIARGENEPAENALTHARALYADLGQPARAAVCNRLLAQLAGLRGDKKGARARLADCRAVFSANDQPIEGALCDLIEGELRFAWGECARAKRLLNHARAKLSPAFPDHAWRADYTLARIAQKQERPRAAIEHYRDAANAIADVRGQLVSEQWSNDFFATRQQVYDDAVNYAIAQNKPSDALAVIESAKAQIFLAHLTRRDWKKSDEDERRTELNARETDLRYHLAALRETLRVTATATLTTRGDHSAELAEYKAVGEEYETVVAQLQWKQKGLAGAPTLARFDLARFRERANARWSKDWLALEYYLRGDVLTIVIIDSQTLAVESHCLKPFASHLLRHCADTRADVREVVYRQTIHNMPTPPSPIDPLRELTRFLIPSRVRRTKRELTLLISPHSFLHQLPFHALKDGDTFLVERFQFVYTPALQAWTQLNAGAETKALGQILACGVDEFDNRARSLPHTAREVQGLRDLFDGQLTALWGKDARRETFRAWNASGALQKLDALHFATHAILDESAPHWSRILLADGELSVTAVLDFSLDASLVTLSACSSATGMVGQGDEIVTLARAFFYAGARALVASLWAVEDDSTAELMTAFYKHLRAGTSIAASLRAAQIELIQQGLKPFHWAPFVAMGNV